MENLHKKFVEMGRKRNKLLNEMLAILPEINESGIWKKHAESIIEYAGKYGGISKSAVMKRLRLEKYLKQKPKLKEAILTAGVNKVDMIARIATPETDAIFADKVNHMSKSAVATLAQELKWHLREGEIGGNKGEVGLREDGIEINKTEVGLSKIDINKEKGDLNKDEIEINKAEASLSKIILGKSELLCRAKPIKIRLELDEEGSFLLMKLKQKWGVSDKEAMKILLQQAVAREFPAKRVAIKAMTTQVAKKAKVITGENFNRLKNGESMIKKTNIKITGEKINRLSNGEPMAKKENIKITGDEIESQKGNIKVTRNEIETEKEHIKITGEKINRLKNGESITKKENIKITGENFNRYINAYTKRAVLARKNGRCDYPNCNKPAVHFHHTERFMTSRSHKSIKPLCKDHHEFAHNGLIQNEIGTNLKLRLQPTLQNTADIFYRRYKYPEKCQKK
jgi:predicted nucleotidyltransferase